MFNHWSQTQTVLSTSFICKVASTKTRGTAKDGRDSETCMSRWNFFPSNVWHFAGKYFIQAGTASRTVVHRTPVKESMAALATTRISCTSSNQKARPGPCPLQGVVGGSRHQKGPAIVKRTTWQLCPGH